MNADHEAKAGERRVRIAQFAGREIELLRSLLLASEDYQTCFPFAFFASSRFAVSLCPVLLLFLSTFAFALSPYSYSQSTGKTNSVYTLRVYEDLVIVDVVVIGKDGKPIKNLRQED